MSWPHRRIRSWEILMKWRDIGTREKGRRIQEKNNHQARDSLTCSELAARRAKSCEWTSGDGGWDGEHRTQDLPLKIGEGK